MPFGNANMSEIALTKHSKLTGGLQLLPPIVAVSLICWLARSEDLSWVAWFVSAALMLLLALIRPPYGALAALIGASTMPRYFIELFGSKVRPEHFSAAIVSMAVLLWFFVYKRRLRLDNLDYWILGYVAINYLSSLVGSSQPSSTLKWALQNNLAVLSYFLIRFIVQDRETLQKAFRILLGVGIAEAGYGILSYASNHAFGTTFGMEIGQYLVDVAAPYGSMYEPNLFGAYAGSCAVLFLALYLFDRHRQTDLLGFLVAALAAFLSFSRAAIIALILAVIWLLWKSQSLRSGASRKRGALMLGFGLILVVVFAARADVLRQRFSALYYNGLTEETAISRFIVIEEALQEVPQHPLLGSGTASFNLSFDWARYIPDWESDKTWIGNTPIRILHDCGVIGLAIFLGFLVSTWRRIRRVWCERHDCAGMALGLAAGSLLYAISFQSTDGTILAFSWVHLGFLASAAVVGVNPLSAKQL
jgi:O-Antigen ligase